MFPRAEGAARLVTSPSSFMNNYYHFPHSFPRESGCSRTCRNGVSISGLHLDRAFGTDKDLRCYALLTAHDLHPSAQQYYQGQTGHLGWAGAIMGGVGGLQGRTCKGMRHQFGSPALPQPQQARCKAAFRQQRHMQQVRVALTKVPASHKAASKAALEQLRSASVDGGNRECHTPVLLSSSSTGLIWLDQQLSGVCSARYQQGRCLAQPRGLCGCLWAAAAAAARLSCADMPSQTCVQPRCSDCDAVCRAHAVVTFPPGTLRDAGFSIESRNLCPLY